MEKTIIATITDKGLGISVSPNMDAATAFQILGTLTTHLLNAYTEVVMHEVNNVTGTPVKDKHAAITGIKESMYDAVNNVLSNALKAYYPEAPRYSLEDEAILKLTNKLIEDRYNKLSPKEKQQYKRAIDKTKQALKVQYESKRS